MNFRQRLVRFLIGIGIGFLLVKMFFGQRGCMQWLPGSQVKKQITEDIPEHGLEIFPDIKCLMDCQGLGSKDIELVLGEDGDVLFAESQKDTIPKEYVIKAVRGTVEFKFGFLLRPDTSNIVTFAERTDSKFDCDCP